MALQDQLVQVPIGAGIDQKTDQRLLPPGKVTSLVNAIFDKIGTVKKRFGNQPLPTTGLYSSSVGPVSAPIPPMQIFNTYKQELTAIDSSGGHLWTLAPNAGVWTQVSPNTPPCSAEWTPVVESTQQFGNLDCVYCNGFLVFSWGTALTPLSFYNINVMVLDAVTQAVVIPPTIVSGPSNDPKSGGFNPKLTAIPQGVGGGCVILTFVGEQGTVPPDAPYVLPMSALKITTVVGQAPTLGPLVNNFTTHPIPLYWMYDTWSDGTYLYVVYDYNTSPQGAGANYIWVDSIRTSDMVVLNTAFQSIEAGVISQGCNGFDVGGTNYLTVQFSYQLSGTNKISVMQFAGINPNFTSVTLTPHVYYQNSSLNGNTFATLNGVAHLDQTHVALLYNNAVDTPGPVGNPTLGEDHGQSVAQLFNITGGSLTALGPPRQNWNVGFGTKPFWVADPTTKLGARCYTLGSIGFENQATAFLFDVGLHDTVSPIREWQPVATLAPRLLTSLPIPGAGIFGGAMTGDITPDGLGHFFTCGAVSVQGQGSQTVRNGMVLFEFDFNSQTQYQGAELSQNLHLGAGTPSYYDGNGVAEIGFTYYPEVTFFANNTGGQIEGPGTYQYCVVYEWVDARGQRHQSAPSIQESVTVNGTGFVNSVELYFPTMTCTSRNLIPVSGSSPFVNMAIYRSILNGTILYRLTSEFQTDKTINYPQSSSFDYLDKQSAGAGGITVSSNEVLYTAGGVLAAFNPPSSRLCVTHGDRLWLAGQDQSKSVWFSQPIFGGSAMIFNDSLSFTVDDGGDITAIIGMDANLIVFKADRIFYVAGTPPNATGQQNNLQNPVPIPSDVGCINSQSVVLTPDGIMFQSSIGIHLLTRALEVQFVGGPVTDTLATFPNITSAVIHPTQNQVRFTCSPRPLNSQTGAFTAGATLVYDYLARAWSTFQITDAIYAPANPNVAGVGVAGSTAAVHQGVYKWASASGWQVSGSTGSVFYEQTTGLTGSFGDGPYFVPMSLETQWVSLGELQGFERVKRVHVLGQPFDSYNLQLSYAIDYSPTYYAANVFTQPIAQNGGVPSNASYRVHIGNQKCEAIRIKIVDVPPTPGAGVQQPWTGQGLSLTRIGLVAGLKKGPQKLPPGQSQ